LIKSNDQQVFRVLKLGFNHGHAGHKPPDIWPLMV
jgi:hypothetical protein